MAHIDDLLDAMTLAEKLGQLTMTAAAYGASGPIVGADLAEAVRTGAVGNLLDLFGAARIHEIQRVAVEETRLKIPLLIGLDVLHGYETLFPVPLGEAALFDPDIWEKTAAEAAKEAAADGINVTFAPMLDVSRDPRWGRGVEGPGEDPFCGLVFCARQGQRFSGRTSRRKDRGDRQTLLRLWGGDGRARICVRRYVRADIAGSLSAAFRCRR